MALVVKTKITEEAIPEESVEFLGSLIDEIGKLDEKLEKAKEKQKELDKEYKEKLLKLKTLVCDPTAEEQVYEFGNETYNCRFGALGRDRVFLPEGMEELKLFVGPEVFMKICKVNLSDVDDYTTPEERKTILEEKRNEKRVFSIKKKKG